MGIFGAAGSGGTSPGGRGCGSRDDTELGSCRLCSPLACGTEGAADLGYRTAAGSLLSVGADLGTFFAVDQFQRLLDLMDHSNGLLLLRWILLLLLFI